MGPCFRGKVRGDFRWLQNILKFGTTLHDVWIKVVFLSCLHLFWWDRAFAGRCEEILGDFRTSWNLVRLCTTSESKSCFCLAFAEPNCNLVRQGRSTTSELGLTELLVWTEGGGYLTKFNTERLLPLPSYILFWQKRYPLYIPFIEKRYPFI